MLRTLAGLFAALALPGLGAAQCFEQSYCQVTPNSTGAPAILASNGNCALEDNAFQLTASPVPEQFGIFIYSAAAAGGNGAPLGNGYLCVGDGAIPIHRMGVEPVKNGVLTRDVDFADLPVGGEIEAGSTWYFQAWYRDPMGGGSKYNLSNGLSVTFQQELTPSVDFTVASQSLAEADGSAAVTVQLSAPSGLDVIVPFTVTGSATGADDYSVLTASPLVIPAGAISADLVVEVSADAIDELDETVELELGPPTNGALGTGTHHVLTIADDDLPPVVRFATAGRTVEEGGPAVSIAVALSAPSGLDVTVPFSLGGDATAGVDYTIDPSPLVIPAGNVSALLTLSPLPDQEAEPGEEAIVTLGPPTYGTLGLPLVDSTTLVDAGCTFPSEDFNHCEGLVAPWAFVDPIGDASVAVTGVGTADARALVSVPGGSNHVPFGTSLPARVVQPLCDDDFEFAVKFDSPLVAATQLHGLTIEQNASNWIRADIYFNGSRRAFVASTVGGTTTPVADVAAPGAGAPTYLRVIRFGDDWTVSWSANGSTWNQIAAFTRALTPTQVGLYAGNAGGAGAPAYTAAIDWFENAAFPIVNEDGPVPGSGPFFLTTGTNGSGVVTRDPDLASYTCSDVVTLTAVPDPGWAFDSWQGDLTGSENPAQVAMTDDRSVTAVFVQDVDPPIISNVQVLASTTTATVTWTTDEPATSRVEYGLTNGYGSVEEDLALVTSHVVMLTGLSEGTTYHFRVCSTDGSNNSGCSGDATFMTATASGLVSDDFNHCEGLVSPWTYLDPFQDGSGAGVSGVGTDDAWLLLSVPGGSNHDPFDTVLPPRAVQPVNDADFQYEIKFESGVTATIQQQGTIVEEGPLDWIRFDVYRSGGTTRAYVGNTVNGDTTTIANTVVTHGVPMYLQVTRLGDQWTMAYSRNPQTLGWTTIASFARTLVPTQVALYGGNSGGAAAPSHVAIVDWFQDTAAPLVSEDGSFPGSGPHFLTTNVIGSGSVVRDPDEPEYNCADVVTLTAVPDPGWEFDEWQGDATGTANPVQVTMDGDKTVTAVFVTDANPPIISDVDVAPASGSALVTWQTNEPATSRVDYGLTSGYGMVVEDLALKTSHSLMLVGLAADTEYHFQITSEDASGLDASTPDATFQTLASWSLASDDFNQCTGIGPQWTFVDPQMDGIAAVQGVGTDDAQLVLTVPGGTSHEAFGTIDAPHLVQSVNDVDFELEVKFESDVEAAYQIQGIVVKQDDLNWLRFDFHHDGSNVRVYAARTIAGTTTLINSVVAATAGQPLWMNVVREGDQWTQSWSDDGVLFTKTVDGVTHSMTVTQAGVFVGNAVGGTAPAHAAVVDYVFDMSSPVAPEDGPFTGGGPFFLGTAIDPPATGEIQVERDLVEYYCSDVVELAAVPDPGFRFVSWTGDLTGMTNPAMLPMTEDRSVTAHFEVDVDPPVISNVQVSVGPTFATVTWTTDEPSTSVVDYGLTAAYGSQESDGTAVTQHSVQLTGLETDTTYHFMVTSCDGGALCSSTSDMTFETTGDGALTSDDFNDKNLDLSVWEWVDPYGEATLHVNGTGTSDAFLEIGVPQGTEYLSWITNGAARVMRAADDTDLEVEVKFESVLNKQYQSVGVVVEADADTWLRFDFYHTGTALRILYAIFDGGANVNYEQTTVANGAWLGAPLYMRVRRLGDVWTQSWSLDGQVWFVNDAAFPFAMQVSKVGVAAGNEAPQVNATTAVVDYFFSTASPIDPEDSGTPPDTRSPFLYRTGGRPSSDMELRVEWFTDEPSTGSVVWGTSAGNYTFGPVQGDSLVQDGFALVSGLMRDTDYHFQVTVDDENGNPLSVSDDFVLTTPPPGFDGLPDFDIWYGETNMAGEKVMSFGQLGIPQPWANVLGRVTDEFGSIASLTYSLNGGPAQALSVSDGVFGSQPLRVVDLGDFNAEIAVGDLMDDSVGLNEVVLTATDDVGNVVQETVWIDFDDGNVWPVDYAIDWSVVSDVTDACQVVDGLWEVWDFGGSEPPRLRNSRNGVAVHGYDRLICVGDLAWGDFEFRFDFEVHALNPLGYTPASNSHAFGVIARWPGHVDKPPFEQPRNGFWPFGGLAAYRWFGPTNERWNAYHMTAAGTRNPNILLNNGFMKVDEGVAYNYKGQCETQMNGTTIYRSRLWPVGSPEPGTWFVEMVVAAGEQPTGSLLILANDVDVSIGNIVVTSTLGN